MVPSQRGACGAFVALWDYEHLSASRYRNVHKAVLALQIQHFNLFMLIIVLQLELKHGGKFTVEIAMF